MARQIGVTTAKLGSIEEGRAPVKFDFGSRFCYLFMVSERWLATGKGAQAQYLSVHKFTSLSDVPLGALFSEIYRRVLSPIYERRLKELPDWASYKLDPGDDLACEERVFRYMLERWKARLSPVENADFFHRLTREAGRYFDELGETPKSSSTPARAWESREIRVEIR